MCSLDGSDIDVAYGAYQRGDCSNLPGILFFGGIAITLMLLVNFVIFIVCGV